MIEKIGKQNFQKRLEIDSLEKEVKALEILHLYVNFIFYFLEIIRK